MANVFVVFAVFAPPSPGLATEASQNVFVVFAVFAPPSAAPSSSRQPNSGLLAGTEVLDEHAVDGSAVDGVLRRTGFGRRRRSLRLDVAELDFDARMKVASSSAVYT